MKLVTIIVPVYKVEEYLDACVASIVNQTYKNLEIILVDDGSPDNCPVMCDEWAKRDNRIKVIHKQNGGLSSARNAGVLCAEGDYITFVDSDDTIQPFYVEVLLTGLYKFPNSDISFGRHCRVDSSRPEFKYKKNFNCYQISKERLLEGFLLRKYVPSPCSVMYSTTLLRKSSLLYDESIKFSEDLHFFWRVFSYVENVVVMDCVIYNYFVRINSITTMPVIEKIKTGYNGIRNITLSDIYLTENCRKYMLSRWVFAVLHNEAKYCDFAFFKCLYIELFGQDHMKILRSFPDWRVRGISIIFLVKLKLAYYVCRVI